jgi:hypothetical protein
MYWNNIDPLIIAGQRRVFEKLGYDIVQCEATGTHHGDWLDRMMEASQPDDALLFVDIDAFPLDRAMVERAFAAAEAGRIIGVAQAANHLADRDFIYAAPAFLSLSRATWERIGRPPFAHDAEADAAMRVSRAAAVHGVPVELIFPNYVAVPRWRLGGKGCLGYGTFYGDGGIFHLFYARRSRHAGLRLIFDHVVERVLAGQEIDYVALYERINSTRFRLDALRLYLAGKMAKRKWRRTTARRAGAL